MCDIREEKIIPPAEIPLWKSLLAEFLGTFILVFIGVVTACLTFSESQNIVNTGLAFGLTLLFLFTIFSQYSGANFNPAITFGFALSGRIKLDIMILYWIVQLIAGITATALIVYFIGDQIQFGVSRGVLTYANPWIAVIIEMLASFFLIITVLLITTMPNLLHITGIIVGSALSFNTIAIKYLTGASLNPARSLGPAIFASALDIYWISSLGPLLGALLAAIIYKLFMLNESK